MFWPGPPPTLWGMFSGQRSDFLWLNLGQCLRAQGLGDAGPCPLTDKVRPTGAGAWQGRSPKGLVLPRTE